MNPIEQILSGRITDLGDFQVQRVLPHAKRRWIGPFVFVDLMGPAEFAPGQGIDVRPHPHIGLATVTYLFEGEFMHRDSVGSVQRIAPGDVNWMTAGRGIVHSERSPEDLRARGHRVHGVQTWVALPLAHEDAAPSFEHHPAATLPQIDRGGVQIRVIAGDAFGERAPVGVLSPTLYCALRFEAGATLRVPAEHEQRALYVVDGNIDVDRRTLTTGQMAVLVPGAEAHAVARGAARAMLLGGAPVGERTVHWNFVASSRDRIEAAREQWARYADPAARGRFGSIAGESEFIPLPAK
jgi:redox-sensitive bicupin YhaK (pirin superfamily)